MAKTSLQHQGLVIIWHKFTLPLGPSIRTTENSMVRLKFHLHQRKRKIKKPLNTVASVEQLIRNGIIFKAIFVKLCFVDISKNMTSHNTKDNCDPYITSCRSKSDNLKFLKCRI